MDEQKPAQKKKISPRKKVIPLKFDREGFYLSFGVGFVTFGIGLLIIWGTLTAPDGGTNSTGFTLYQRLARQLPDSIQEKIALVLGALFMLFGFFLVLAGIKQTVQFLIRKIKSPTQ